MNVPFFIAKKYFFSKKKRSFIHFISIISMVGVCLGTMALVIVLSVFNGLEDLNRQIFKAFDPDLKISSTSKRSFIAKPSLKAKLLQLPDVAYITEVYQDKALARSNDAQMIVEVKGVDSTFLLNQKMNKALIEGQMKLYSGTRPNAFVGGGVFNVLDLQVDDFLNPLALLYPRNQKIDVLNPEGNINQMAVEVAGVFVLEQQYDHYVYLPLATVEDLTGNIGKRTAYEISLKNEADLTQTKHQIAKLIGPTLNVKDRDQQNASLLRAIKIEKMFIFIALFFIIGIASFNIFYSLSMLVIDKKDDIETLSAIGASKAFIGQLFVFEGFIISTMGLILGLALGLGLCFLQMQFGFIKLGMEFAMVDAYPVKIIGSDLTVSVLGILVITFLATVLPARKAQKFMFDVL
jgi:lipoprotein-releasing system permease protein